jgi:CRP/FNR family cyclic AMP-dependent transcriptional regulator
MTPNVQSVPLEDALLRAIAQRGSVARYPANAVVISEGDAADSLYIVVSGRLKIYVGSASGKEVILRTAGPGDYFGELALDGGKRSASAMTLEPTQCVLVTGSNLRQFIIDHPDFAQRLIVDLSRRVRQLTDNVRSLALDDVYTRVVRLLQLLSVADGDRRVLPHRLTQQDIADHVGSSREMVSRILKELTVGGYIAIDSGRIALLKTPPAAW